jgi:hypothetical protein
VKYYKKPPIYQFLEILIIGIIFPFSKIILRGLLDFKFFGYLLGVNVIARQTKSKFGFKAYGMKAWLYGDL